MAHPQETREKLRRSYIFGQMSLEIASAQAGVAFATARRWKKEAQDAGDDWDKLRAAHLMAGNGLEEIGRAILTGLMTQYQTTLELLTTESQLPPGNASNFWQALPMHLTKPSQQTRKYCRR